MSSALDLVVLNGPREEDVVQLKPTEPLRLGRSLKGFQLVDPLVSLAHAEVAWEGDRYWVEDLGSATGTFVNDVRLTDKPVVIVPGMRIRLGETVLEVRPRPKSTLLRVVGGMAALFLVFVAFDTYRRSISVEYAPRVVWYQPVNQGGGVASNDINVPDSFIRSAGVDHRGLKIDDVTDYDEDGIDEMWLSWESGARGRRVVTFDDSGSWLTIGEFGYQCKERARSLAEGLPAECYLDASRVRTDLPAACKRSGSQQGFPDMDCNGVIHRYVGGEYQIVGLDGVVTWMPRTEEYDDLKRSTKQIKAKARRVIPGPDVPYLFTLSRPSQMAGFLERRGINEPIHYLICEDALPGIMPQVLTQRGEIVQLTVGCLGDVDLAGVTRLADFGDTRPSMFAFTGNGYEALLHDLFVFLSGEGEGGLASGRQHQLLADLWSAPARRQGAIRLMFTGPERMRDPVAEDNLVSSSNRLLATEFSDELPPLGHNVKLPAPGVYDLEGCSELKVDVSSWHCLSSKGCSASSPFMRIRNVGCGGDSKPVTIPYRAGGHTYRDANIVGKVWVDAYEASGQVDVLRVRMAYRDAPAKATE